MAVRPSILSIRMVIMSLCVFQPFSVSFCHKWSMKKHNSFNQMGSFNYDGLFVICWAICSVNCIFTGKAYRNANEPNHYAYAAANWMMSPSFMVRNWKSELELNFSQPPPSPSCCVNSSDSFQSVFLVCLHHLPFQWLSDFTELESISISHKLSVPKQQEIMIGQQSFF